MAHLKSITTILLQFLLQFFHLRMNFFITAGVALASTEHKFPRVNASVNNACHIGSFCKAKITQFGKANQNF